MQRNTKNNTVSHILRGLVEVLFIIFLFYSNLLMGDYTHNGSAHGRNIFWGIHDVFTEANFEIALVAAILGYILFESLRKLW
jgi:hypothetical protein